MQSATSRLSSPGLYAVGLAILAIALISTGASSSAAGPRRSGTPAKRVVAQAQNPTLGRTILTTRKGRTLYSLSVERHGKFICTGSCLSVWHPLVVPAGVKPTGPVRLGTIVRPDNGNTQVTFEGRPLYRFSGDTRAGETNGEGIKDVGTWHAAGRPLPTAPTPEPPAPPYPSPEPAPPYPSPQPTPPYPY